MYMIFRYVVSKNTYKYGVRRFTVNILVSTQVNVHSFLEKPSVQHSKLSTTITL